MTFAVSPCRQIAAFGLVLGLVHGAPLGGQTESRDPHLRNDCRRAGQILQTGRPAPHYEWAMGMIHRCRESGGEVLASVWGHPPADSASLNSLFLASYRLRDARITEAAIAAASNVSAPQLVRLNAIRVIVGHAYPRFLVALSELPPTTRPGEYRTLGSVSHVVVTEGIRPIGPETIESILNTLSRLSSDLDPRIADAASYTLRELTWTLRSTGQQERL